MRMNTSTREHRMTDEPQNPAVKVAVFLACVILGAMFWAAVAVAVLK